MIESIVIPGAAGAALLVSGAWLYGAPLARRRAETSRLADYCSRTRTLCLTYDDGPGKDLTPRVMSALHSRSAKATFFLLGRRAEMNPAIADGVRNAGHEIGCHAHEHVHAWRSAPWASARDAARGYESMSRWLPEPCLFRPPYGKSTALSRREATKRGSRLGWWTIDSGDTWDRTPAVESVVDRVAIAGGGVVLLHDFDREDDDSGERADFVVDVTNALLDRAEAESWRVKTLGDVLDAMERDES